ncbi:MAG: TRAP transporter large permease [Elusimicrobiaceae bacterium]|nr:TRAP transporter large permease [Elusimicrobiaceae bacterium]
MSIALTCGLILLISLLILLMLGVPISVSLGCSATLAMLVVLPGEKAALMAAQKTFTGINSFTLLAIPFFILAGIIMNNGGIARRLVNLAKAIVGRLPGALALTDVVANMLFGSISGSGSASCAAIGSIITPMAEEEGYDKDYIAAVNVASAPSGILIPPSNTLIIYSTVAGGVSITSLFLAGYIPGIMWGLGVMILAFCMAKKRGYKGAAPVPMKEFVKIAWQAIPSLLLIVVVIGGILLGIFTPTEASAIAVCYALVLSFIYKTITVKDLPRILLEAAELTCIIVFLIGLSSIMSWILAFTKIPDMLASGLLSLSESPIGILLIMNVLLLAIGTFMDPTPAILIFTPIFLPIALKFGMDPVQFGIMMTFNLCIGCITPPVGAILFTGCKVSKIGIEQIIRPLIPFFAVLAAILLMVTFIPALSLWIPKIAGLL